MILSQKEKIGVIFFIEKIPNLGGEFEGGLAKYQTFYCIFFGNLPYGKNRLQSFGDDLNFEGSKLIFSRDFVGEAL